MKKYNGVRTILIHAMEREKLIGFIKRKDSFYIGTNFAGHSDTQLRSIALQVDKETHTSKQIIRQSKKNKPSRNDL